MPFVNGVYTGCTRDTETGMDKRRMRDRIGPPATILGPGAELRGALQGEGHFLIVGRVTGEASIRGALTLAAGGRWKGNIEADDVILAGEMDGELVARGRVEILASARVTGRVVGKGISICAGAVVEAELKSLDGNEIVTFDERRTR
jgi:cytoskeletal protein CcmA (bactofilin family)